MFLIQLLESILKSSWAFYVDLEDAKTKLTTLNNQLEVKEADIDRYMYSGYTL